MTQQVKLAVIAVAEAAGGHRGAHLGGQVAQRVHTDIAPAA